MKENVSELTKDFDIENFRKSLIDWFQAEKRIYLGERIRIHIKYGFLK